MTDRPPIIECTGLTKVYDMGASQVRALDGVDFSVGAGDFVGVMGASGSGKSTLLHILGCLDRPTDGRYFLDGEDVAKLEDRALSLIRATKIGFVFQSFNLIPQCDVYENVALPFQYRGERIDSGRLRERVGRAVDRVGLSARMDHRPTQLSGGEMQRVAIARALAGEPLVILADEPTGNLDSKTSGDIMDLFSDLNAQGVTVITITHDDSVASHCKRILRLADGALEAHEA